MDIFELRQLKKEVGMTNAEISELSSVPVSTVNKIFSGATENPRYATLLAIEEALRQKQKLPFSYDEITEEPCLIREQVAYRYNSRKYSMGDIEKLEDGRFFELIDGILYLKGAPNRMHEFMVMNIAFELQTHIRKQNGKCHVYVSNLGVRLFEDNQTYVKPDVVVICNKDRLTNQGCDGAPDLAVEVISPHDSVHDYLTKMMKYQKAGVKEYWIVDPELQVVFVYDFEEHSKSAKYQYEDIISSDVLEGFTLRIADFIDKY